MVRRGFPWHHYAAIAAAAAVAVGERRTRLLFALEPRAGVSIAKLVASLQVQPAGSLAFAIDASCAA